MAYANRLENGRNAVSHKRDTRLNWFVTNSVFIVVEAIIFTLHARSPVFHLSAFSMCLSVFAAFFGYLQFTIIV